MSFKYLLFPFLASLVGCLLFARAAPWLSLMDEPDERKRHARAVPVVGGIAVFAAWLVALKLRELSGNLVTAILPVGLMLVVGTLDDMRPLRARTKLLAQMVAAWLLCYTSSFVLADLAGLPLGPLALPLTMLFFVGVINAINMADGADGLAGGYVLVSLCALLCVALLTGKAVTVLLLAGLVSALLGFLACNMRHPFNRQALVFLGDAGALSLGVVLCWFAIDLSQNGRGSMPPVVMLYILAVPLVDLVTVSLRRWLEGQSPMKADRRHLHHLLLDQGMPVSRAVPLLWLAHAAVAAAGLAMWQLGVSEAFMLFAFMLGVLASFGLLRRHDRNAGWGRHD